MGEDKDVKSFFQNVHISKILFLNMLNILIFLNFKICLVQTQHITCFANCLDKKIIQETLFDQKQENKGTTNLVTIEFEANILYEKNHNTVA